MVKVFFDASVLFSALYSEKGASYYLVKLVKQNKIIVLTTQTVIRELQSNLHKIKQADENKLNQLIINNHFIVREEITVKELSRFNGLVEKKDQHVLAGAVLIGCQYLVTLDKKHLDNKTVRVKIKEIKILSPKNLLFKLLKI